MTAPSRDNERRRDAWNADYDALVAMIEQYEDEHPDDAKCFGEAEFRIDGVRYHVQVDSSSSPRVQASDSPRWCERCKSFGGHHTDRHDQHVCSCGNLFGDDNLCMVSACQDET